MSFSKIYRATVSAKRKPGVSQEEFSRRFAHHGTLAGPVLKKHDCITYIQVPWLPCTPGRLSQEFKSKLGPDMAAHLSFAEADGIINLIFPTLDDLVGFFKDPAHAESLNADVAEFADPVSTTFAIGDEVVVIQGGELRV
ncbi:hypothetical protein FALBO_4995 [Fusarium albosuccineum]|uniref:EthD domain-containing protein n=1 Tax=Fusarium albosuccineum TaxID=1237068 RepID=A0A8H4PD46_9HYPO|nr:hypothetical protein FALBO_4995 [Fusarium albosuccineum]